MSRAVVACVVLASGCLDIQPFGGGGAIGSIGDVSVVADGNGGATATGPGYVLHFADAVPHYPDSFLVGGTQVLATGGKCERGSLMGVDLHPAVRSDMPSSDDTAALNIEIAGPSIARVTIDWNANLGGTCGTATVNSWFTFFPDGRITRYDTVNGQDKDATSCSCDGSTSFDIATEALYAASVSTFLYGPTVAPTPSPTGGDNITDTTCMSTTNFNLFVADGPGPNPELFPVSSDLAVAYKLGGDLVGLGMSTVVVLPTTTLCTDIVHTDLGYAYPPNWTINAGGAYMDVFDGIANGYSPYNGDFGVQVTNTATIHLDPPTAQNQASTTPDGFAFAFDFDQPYSQFSVTKNGTALTGDALRIQMLPTDHKRIAVWLRDPMTQDDTVVVTGTP